MPGKTITNAVLLEKLSHQSERQKELMEKFEKLDTKVTQNFDSMASVLQQGYVKKEELQFFKDEVPKIYAEISKRLHKDAFAPYSWAAKIVGSLILSGAVYFAGKMMTDYIRGGPPL